MKRKAILTTAVVGIIVCLLGAAAPAQAAPFVYVTNQDQGVSSISQYEVGAGGLLAPLDPPKVFGGIANQGVAVSPNGESVYVSNTLSDTVSQYDVGADGTLTPKSPATVAAGFRPTALAVTPAPRVPTSKEQCKNGGWRNFPHFKNQGQCIAFVNHGQ